LYTSHSTLRLRCSQILAELVPPLWRQQLFQSIGTIPIIVNDGVTNGLTLRRADWARYPKTYPTHMKR